MNPRLSILALIGSLLGGCDGGPTAPWTSHGLELSVQVVPFHNRLEVQPSFTSVLRNASHEEITVVFPNSCTVRPYIDDGRGDTVFPGWGGCYEIVSPVKLAPGAAIARTIELRSGPTPAIRSNAVTLPSGHYVAYAEIDGSIGDIGGQRVTLRTRGVLFEVP